MDGSIDVRTASGPQKVTAPLLALILASCSATRYSATGPTGPQDLARYVLVVEKTPGGQMTHAWKPIRDFDLTRLQYTLSRVSTHPGVVRVSTAKKDYCRGRGEQCLQDCLASSRPMPVGHLRYPTYRGPWRINRGWWCQEACAVLEDLCNRGMGEWAEEYAVEFKAIEPAVDWIKRHREEILVGTVIVIAGVAFAAAVVASGGGALVLVPLVALAEEASGELPTMRISEASQ